MPGLVAVPRGGCEWVDIRLELCGLTLADRKESYKGVLRTLGIKGSNVAGSWWLCAGLTAGGITPMTSLRLAPSVPHRGVKEAGLVVQFPSSRAGRKHLYFLDVSLNH